MKSDRKRTSLIYAAWVGLLLAGCAGTTPPVPSISSWGPITTLGRAEQTDAPALLSNDDGLWAAWVSADESGVHHNLSILRGGAVIESAALSLPAVRPYAQQLLPAGDGELHLMWLDAGDHDETRLYSALISSTLTVERGPTAISERATGHYTAVSAGGGSVLAVWSETNGGETAIHSRYVDAEGRPRLDPPRLVARDADWPSLIRATAGTIYLYWRRPSDGQLLWSRLSDSTIDNPHLTAQFVGLESGDRLVDFSAGMDETHAYLFWNVTRVTGQTETWMSSGVLGGKAWSASVRLGIKLVDGRSYETGLNTGLASAASSGTSWISWASPLHVQFRILPVAVYNADAVGIVYLRGGAIEGYQTIASSVLIGTPALIVDRDQFLFLAWSQPGVDGASLQITTFQP